MSGPAGGSVTASGLQGGRERSGRAGPGWPKPGGCEGRRWTPWQQREVELAESKASRRTFWDELVGHLRVDGRHALLRDGSGRHSAKPLHWCDSVSGEQYG
ncbi:hypothetical protein llap_2174 [Limosa lapponica baueri]|uniref:Uncharacterized protein n=1 Tax=Limosa lapponica baueri TaxID=1758121 RepID=A0A2I0UNB9_LIMLA|nr:hypothetical protein llap_2174 [Limosa lapponica baueri]